MVLTKFRYFLVPAFALIGAGPPQITTSQYDNARSGANVSENILSPGNVNARQFGKIWSLPVDGDVYAQPLFLPNVDLPGKGVHNVLFVVTEHDSVYAFDADKNSPTPLWRVSLLPSDRPAAPVADSDAQCPFIRPEIGITSTPVIDTGTGTLYVLARLKIWTSRSNARYVQQLHALAITTGAEKFGGPVEIRASIVGTRAGSSGGEVSFDALRENPRAALLLVNGSVFLSWGSSCDVGPYHGWVMAYDARTLRQQAVLNTSPDSGESGIWLSDTGPAADRLGNVYVVTGNGQFDANAKGGRDYGDTALKLRLQGNRFEVEDYFTPFDQRQLNSTDQDLGSGGPLLLPGGPDGKPAGLIFGGKAGVMYVVDPEHMGGFHPGSDAGAAKIRLSNGIYSAPAFWNGHLYYYAEADALKEFVVENGRVSQTPSHRSPGKSPFSGSTPTVSGNGNANGIVWIVDTRAWNRGGSHAVLRAYEALNVGRELYSSDQNSSRDKAGEAVRFAIPAVANGRVYFGVRKAVDVYGLLRAGAPPQSGLFPPSAFSRQLKAIPWRGGLATRRRMASCHTMSSATSAAAQQLKDWIAAYDSAVRRTAGEELASLRLARLATLRDDLPHSGEHYANLDPPAAHRVSRFIVNGLPVISLALSEAMKTLR